MKNLLLTVLLIGSASSCLWAQDVHVTSLPSQRMLPEGNVHHIYQDRDGYMWYSTDECLCRDNGYQIDVFATDSDHPGLFPTNQFLAVVEDDEHHLWTGTTHGLCIIDKKDFSVKTIQVKEAEENATDALIAVSDGTIWAACGKYLLHFDSHLKLLDKFEAQSKGVGGKYTNALYEDSRHTLWLLENGGGIRRYDHTQKIFTPCLWESPLSPQVMIEDAKHGCFWIATWGAGIVKYTPASLGFQATSIPQAATVSRGAPGMIDAQVIDMRLDNNASTLWVSTMDGLKAFKVDANGTLLPYSIVGLIPEGKKTIAMMTTDKKGRIWVSGNSPSTFILSPQSDNVRHEKCIDNIRRTGHETNCERLIFEGDDVWIWQIRMKLSFFQQSSERMMFSIDQKDFPDGFGSGVLERRIGKPGVWTADDTWLEAAWREGEELKMQRIAQFSSPIHSVRQEKNGRLWVGCLDSLCSLGQDGSIHTWFRDTHAILQTEFDGDSVVYMMSWGKGLLRGNLKTGKWTPMTLENETATCMKKDRKGHLWVGTQIGHVYLFDLSKQTYSLMEEMNSREVAHIIRIEEDAKGHLWVLTGKSVREYEPDTWKYRVYRSDNRNINMDFFSTIVVKGDSVCVGGENGFCMIGSSSNMGQSTADALPEISSCQLDGEKKLIGVGQNGVDVPAGTSLLELFLTTKDFLHANDVMYAYRINEKGLFGITEGRWVELEKGNNAIRLMGLKKGDYVVEVKATDQYGAWGETVECFTIKRLPAWWETWWAYTLYALLVIGGIVLAFRLYHQRLKRKREARMEQELMEMKFGFFTNVSHELRTPLTLIQTPLESVLKRSTSLQEGERRKLEGAYEHAKELQEMINQLLDFRKMEMGNEKLRLSHADMVEWVSGAVEAFRPLAEKKGVNLMFVRPQDFNSLYMNFDQNKMHHIIYNLLSNALKFTSEGGSVKVSMEQDDKYVLVHVSDTGCGIPQSEQEKVFRRFYQVGNGMVEGGTGIGLHMVSEMVRHHFGYVSLQSEEGKGSTFTVKLPKDLRKEVEMDGEQLGVETDQAADNVDNQGNASLLIVEDNVEFRQMLAEELRDEGYSVVEAGNGKEALQMAHERAFDIIISDVMMPVMDGFELCKTLKSDVSISHIPVIMLTAKSGDENMLQGYKMGADVYLTKPFNLDVLTNRIHTLLKQHEERQENFQKTEEVDTDALTISKADEELINKAVAVVEKNMDNTNYSVEQFASDMCMSRMSLFRKIQHVTGQSPTDFIKTLRLKRAAYLLKNTSHSISIISDLVGFSTPSYFTKCFKEMFGKLPKEMRV